MSSHGSFCSGESSKRVNDKEKDKDKQLTPKIVFENRSN